MLERIHADGDLNQADAVEHIRVSFGEEYVYLNEGGNAAIVRPVLDVFRRLSKDAVVWDRSELCWRLRISTDGPGRMTN
jgi:hypothetical protein